MVAAASMGPRRDWRGYRQRGTRFHAGEKLQWGHAVIGVDTTQVWLRVSLFFAASMGPRRDWRGYNPALFLPSSSHMLQWGHAVIGVDTTRSPLGLVTTGRFNGATP